MAGNRACSPSVRRPAGSAAAGRSPCGTRCGPRLRWACSGLRNRGLGTSGSAFQQFVVDGRAYGHILDPRTGEPAAGGPASVTVLAPTAADADALSTALYLLGPEAAREHVKRNPEVGVVMVQEGPADRSPRVLTFGLGQRGFPDRRQRVRLDDVSVKIPRARVLAGERGCRVAFDSLSDPPGPTIMPSSFDSTGDSFLPKLSRISWVRSSWSCSGLPSAGIF